MKIRSKINPAYSHLENFIRALPDIFDTSGEVLFSRRNEIRLIENAGLKLVIKNFRTISTANKITFSVTHVTKARKAYENSVRIEQLGIHTPTPVGYVDIYRRGFLMASYFIYLYTPYKSAGTFFDLPYNESEEPLKAFAQFTYRIQKLGIFHNDYNLGNVLYSVDKSKYDFNMVDINRVRFHPYSFKRGMKNLCRLYLPVEKLCLVGSEYSRAAGTDEINTISGLFYYMAKFQSRNRLKGQFKNILRHKKQV